MAAIVPKLVIDQQIVQRREEASGRHLVFGVVAFELLHVGGTLEAPVYHRRQVVEQPFQCPQVLLPVGRPHLEHPHLQKDVLEHFRVFTYLKRAQCIYFAVCHRLHHPEETSECSSKLFQVFDLRVEETTVDDDRDFVGGRGFETPFEVGLQELHALLVEEEPVLVELVHLLTQLDHHVHLRRLRKEVELGGLCLDHPRQQFLIISPVHAPYRVSNPTHLRLLMFVHCLIR